MKTTQRNYAIVGLLTLLRLTAVFAPTALGQDAILATNRVNAAAQTPAAFEKTLREFVTIAAKDQAVCSLLSKHRLTLDYTIADQGLRCYVGFDGEKVVGIFGRQSQQPELAFVSNAGTLDRLLRGEDCQSEMKVTVRLGLARKISLKRDLKQIRAALAHVYTTACDKVSARSALLAQADVR